MLLLLLVTSFQSDSLSCKRQQQLKLTEFLIFKKDYFNIFNVEVMAITKYARTVHTGSDPQRQPGQPEAAHGSPPHPAVMNPCFSTTEYSLLRLMIQKAQLAKAATSAISFCLSMRSRTGSPAVQEGEAQHTSSSPPHSANRQAIITTPLY